MQCTTGSLSLVRACVLRESQEAIICVDESVAGHLLNGKPGVTDCDDTSTPLLLIDTAGCEVEEVRERIAVRARFAQRRIYT